MPMTLPPFQQARVLVVGDIVLDRYWSGSSDRISPEAPVPVVNVQQREERPGGAANVAMNVASLGANTCLVGLTGVDEAARSLNQALRAANITNQIITDPTYQTLVKLRVLSQHQQLLRLDFETCFQPSDAERVLAHIQQQALIDSAEVLVLSDYAKGALSTIPALIQLGRAAGIPVCVDPKGSDFSRYQGATLLTPNRTEFQAVVGHCPDETTLVARGMQLLIDCDLEALLITRSEQGMTLLRRQQPPYHLPTQAQTVFDVTGAGDTVIAVVAAALAAGSSLERACELANVAAGLVVKKLGTASVTCQELEQALFSRSILGYGILNELQLKQAVAVARRRGERIVMTHGCFDILHAGHVNYLSQARQWGDRLIVAIRSDASIRCLKGSQSPIYPLAQRLQVVTALSAVDWVVIFDEESPERLIANLLPDVLVTGGGAPAEASAGAQAVQQSGGTVQILDVIADCTITATIHQLHQKRGGIGVLG
jgi:D-beta-D-heptose 7-phosphate kinase / D-beta-D-heptose 1-phosphate adenosyltransferase